MLKNNSLEDSTFLDRFPLVEELTDKIGANISGGAWFNCDVVRVGPGWNNRIFIALTDRGGNFTNRWFVAQEGLKREMLDTALVAKANGIRVSTFLGESGNTDPDPAQYTVISALYLS